MLERPKPPITVRDMMNAFTARFGVSRTGNWNLAKHTFWEKLCQLGGRGMDRVKQVTDIDATVVLSDDEVTELEEEMAKL